MRNPEYFLEFTKMLKSKNNVSVLDLLIKDPFSAFACFQQNPDIRKDYKDWKVGNSFAKRLLTENTPHEDISIAHNILREIIARRMFVNGAFTEEAYHHVDFFSQQRGFVQTANETTYNAVKLGKDMRQYSPDNRPTVNVVDIFTRNDQLDSFDYTKLDKPKFNVVVFQNLKPITVQQIAEVEKGFYANEAAILEIQETQMKPLVKLHKKFLENPENTKVDWSSWNPKFNHKNQAKNELDFALHKFKSVKLIEY